MGGTNLISNAFLERQIHALRRQGIERNFLTFFRSLASHNYCFPTPFCSS